jgi:hypothetical protein
MKITRLDLAARFLDEPHLPLRRDAALAPFVNGGAFRPKVEGALFNLRRGQGCFGHFVSIGQIVQYVKDKMSNARIFFIGTFGDMGQASNEELLFNEALCARTRALRDGKGWTAEQMATVLGVPPDRYRKYENRSPIPHYLVPRLAGICDVTIEYILTGRSPRMLAAPSCAPAPARIII